MSYITLGSRTKIGSKDQTGNNTGNWTVQFASADLDTNVPYFEVWKMVVTGAVNSQFTMSLGANQLEPPQKGDTNVWTDPQPLTLTPSTELTFYWNDPVSDNMPPKVTLYLRYDPALEANLGVRL